MADDAGRIEALYDVDIVAWAEQQAEALRRRAGAGELDWDNLAEEIEDVAKRELRACESHLDIIIKHLLKLEFAPRAMLERDRRGWRASVRAARYNLRRELTPTLRVRLPEELPSACAQQVKIAQELGLILDEDALRERLKAPYAWAEVTDEDWWPARR